MPDQEPKLPENAFTSIVNNLASIVGLITAFVAIFAYIREVKGWSLFTQFPPNDLVSILETIGVGIVVAVCVFVLTLIKSLFRDIKEGLKRRNKVLTDKNTELAVQLKENPSDRIPKQAIELQKYIDFEREELALIEKSKIKQIYNLISVSYKKDQAQIFFRFQYGLRLVFLAAVSLAAMLSLDLREDKTLPHSQLHFVWLNVVQIAVCSVALILWLSSYKVLSARIKFYQSDKMLSAEEKHCRIDDFFWVCAKVDLATVTALMLFSPSLGREVHLGYLLPLMISWLSSTDERQRAGKVRERCANVIKILIAGVFVKAIFEMALASDSVLLHSLWDKLQSSEGVYSKLTYLVSWLAHFFAPLGGFLAHCAFWGGVGVLFALLRFLRTTEKINAHEARDHSRNEHFLRSALELLCTSQKIAVFIKNADRSFKYANSTLLESLPPRKDKRPWSLGLLQGETDATICITNKKYDESDRLVLSAKSKEDENNHFEGMEPTFRNSDHRWKRIWTVKHAIWGTEIKDSDSCADRPIGLVGQVVEGRPVQMKQMAEQLTEGMPIYATMKDSNGRVVWANKKYLQGMAKAFLDYSSHLLEVVSEEEKKETQNTVKGAGHDKKMLNELVDNLKIILKQQTETSGELRIDSKTEMAVLEQGLQQYNNGDGPTDKLLYGDELPRYFVSMDKVIEGAVNDPTISDDRVLDEVNRRIKDYFGTNISHGPMVEYPVQGWIEYHKFPGEKDGRWVSVHKIPTWVCKTNEVGVQERHLEYLLVFFEDVHKRHLRRAILGRWSKKYLPRAKYASCMVLESSLACIAECEKALLTITSASTSSRRKKTPERVAQQNEQIALLKLEILKLKNKHQQILRMPLLRIHHSLLNWAREFIEGEPHFGSSERCDHAELVIVCRSLESFFENKVQIELKCIEEFVLPSRGDEFVAVMVLLLMNAMHAVEGCSDITPGERKVSVSIDHNENTLKLTVANKFTVLTEQNLHEIRTCQVLDAERYPGGGIFVANKLLHWVHSDCGMDRADGHSILISYDNSTNSVKAEASFPGGLLGGRRQCETA